MDFDSLVEDESPKEKPKPDGLAWTPSLASQPVAPPSFDDLKPDEPKDFDSLQDDGEKTAESPSEESLGEQAVAGLEGAAEGIAGPLATFAETRLGVDPKGIKERSEKYPLTHGGAKATALGASLLVPGLGEYSLAGNIAKTAGVASEIANFGKVGSGIIKGAINAGLFQGADKLTQAMLSDSNPEEPAASAMTIGASALFGGVLGGTLGAASPLVSRGAQKLEELSDGAAQAKMKSFLSGIAAASKGMGPNDVDKFKHAADIMEESVHHPSFDMGMKFYSKMLHRGVSSATQMVGGGYGGVPGYIASKTITPYVERIIGKAANKIVTPAILKIASSGSQNGIGAVMKYANTISKGANAISGNIENLFTTSAAPAYNMAHSELDREKLRKYVDDDEIMNQVTGTKDSPQGFADGGLAQPQITQPNGIEQHYPAQNMMIQATKMRIHNYLNSVKPREDQQRLPFEKKIPNKSADRKYNQVLDMANQPLSIFKDIKDGSLTKEHMQHFTSMYPELYGHLSKKMTDRIAQAQLKDERPSFRVRQAMSLFLNAPMDKSMTAQTVQSVQAMYAQSKGQPQQQGAPAKNKKGTSSLSKLPSNYKTAGQALEARQQKDS